MKKVSVYHSVLRSGAGVLALVLLFDSGLIAPVTKELSHETQRYLATGIGIHAGVEPTELNQITAALTAKEQELAAREQALNEREISVDLARSSSDQNTSTYVLSALLFILLLLILLNYALDFYRARPLPRVQYE